MILKWLLVPVMGWLSRMCGGAPPNLGRPWPQILYAMPVALTAWPAGVIWTLLSLGGAFFGKSTGHGQWMSLAHVIKKVHEEPLDFIVAWFWGADPRVVATDDAQAVILSNEYGLTKLYWRCVFGMAVVGVAVTLVGGVALILSGMAGAGALLILSGICKAPAYMIGWIIYPTGQGQGPQYLNQATAIGELLTGVATGIAVALAWPL